MKVRVKAMKGVGKAKIIDSITLSAESVDELALITAMVRCLFSSGKIRAEPQGFPATWVRFDVSEDKESRNEKGE